MSVARIWFEEAWKLEMNQALFVRVANKKEQTKLVNEFESERELFSRLDPVHASQIFIKKALMERNHYVVLERKYRAPFTAFIRNEDGKFSKISVEPERKQLITLMLKDGLSRKEIEEIISDLTEDEVLFFFSGEKSF